MRLSGAKHILEIQKNDLLVDICNFKNSFGIFGATVEFPPSPGDIPGAALIGPMHMWNFGSANQFSFSWNMQHHWNLLFVTDRSQNQFEAFSGIAWFQCN